MADALDTIEGVLHMGYERVGDEIMDKDNVYLDAADCRVLAAAFAALAAELDADHGAAGHVSHDEAEAILRRFNASHWGNPEEHARYSIPADPKRDDDIRLAAYIAAARKTEADRDALAAEVARLREALAESEARAAKGAGR